MTTYPELIQALSPVLVAIVAAYSSVVVARIGRIQKEISTESSTKNLGESVDQIRGQINQINHDHPDVLNSLEHIESQLQLVSMRLDSIELQVRKDV
jgi:predicted  nucleic acid-binding Zn-ribbon protein